MLKNQFFPKCSFSEKVDAVQKYLLWKSSSFLAIFILNSSSEKNSCSEKWLLCRIFAPKKKLFWKDNSCEKVSVLKKEKTAGVLKKYLPRKSNFCVEVGTLKKCEEVASTKIKFSWKSGNICEKGNRYLKRRNQIRLAITFNFPHKLPSPLSVFMGNLIWILTRVARINRERNHEIMFVSYYFHKF